MTTFLERFSEMIGRINDWMGKLSSGLTIIMMLLICFDVLAKWLAPKLGIHYSNTAIYETQWHLFAVIFLVGAAFTLRHDRHVRVDVFYANFSERKKHWVNLLGTLFFLLPFCFIVMETSIIYVKNSYLMNESSSDPGGLPYRFALKAMIIVGFALLFLQGIAIIAQSMAGLLKKESAS